MTDKERETVESLTERLRSADPNDRCDAAARLRQVRGDRSAAVPLLLAALDDEGSDVRRSGPDADGAEYELVSYVALEALLTLAQIAPDAAPERVAATVVRLHGVLQFSDFLPVTPRRDQFLHWRARDLAPFGQPVVDALERIAQRGGEEGQRAKEVLADLARSRRPS
jgi:hypothetical protein